MNPVDVRCFEVVAAWDYLHRTKLYPFEKPSGLYTFLIPATKPLAGGRVGLTILTTEYGMMDGG